MVVVAPPLRYTSRYCRLAARYAKTFEQRFDSKRVEQFNPANKKSASELNKAWKEQLAVYADLGSIDMVTTATQTVPFLSPSASARPAPLHALWAPAGAEPPSAPRGRTDTTRERH